MRDPNVDDGDMKEPIDKEKTSEVYEKATGGKEMPKMVLGRYPEKEKDEEEDSEAKKISKKKKKKDDQDTD